MTSITQTVWQCDFCGVKSPPLQDGHSPLGWVTMPDLEKAPMWFSGKRYPHYRQVTRHFCQDYHREKWLAEFQGEGLA